MDETSTTVPDTTSQAPAAPGVAAARARTGRPRSNVVHRKILDATRDVLSEEGFTKLRLEHVAARAGVGKATIYRRWGSKEALAQELLAELAGPHIAIPDTGDTREELLAAILNPMHAVTDRRSVPGHRRPGPAR
jgi:AcrR family transcriptional regulator